MDKKEKIFYYGAEGGGETFYRITLPGGGTKFITEGGSMDLDENDNDTNKK